ncbi:MAG TPA: MFS transporter [Pseudonocardiaceae bacterium]|jgi:MFS family permease|nr:MFS transporter [Pseudonocardiaceae bacterium]
MGDTGLRTRLGLPALRGRGRLAIAMVVDTIGSGMFLPFGVIYFLHVTTLSLTLIGTGLTAASLLAMPVALLLAPLLDRFGSRRVVIAGNLISALAFVGYLFVGTEWQLIVAALLASAGSTTFWLALRGLIGEVVEAPKRPAWFALQSSIRNAGLGLGGVLGAIAVSSGSRAAYLLLAGVNAVSYLLAGGLVLSWRGPAEEKSTARQRPAAGATVKEGYWTLLRDRALMLVTGLNLAFVLCYSALNVLLAVYLTEVLGLPAWLAGAVYTVNTVLVVLAQTVISQWAGRFRRTTVLRGAAGCWALAFALFAALLAMPRPVPLAIVLVAAVLVFTFAEILQGPTINSLVVDLAPADAPGRHLAAFQLSWSLGQAAAPALLTWLLSRGAALPWLALVAVCVLAAAAVSGLRGRTD